MPLTPRNEEELQKDFELFCAMQSSILGRLVQSDTSRIAGYWLAKLSSEIEAERERIGDHIEENMFQLREHGEGDSWKTHKALSGIRDFINNA